MDSEKVIKRDNNYVLHTYGRNPIVLEKGHGLYAEGPEGQKYLDFTSGIGVNSLGYCDLTWAEAVSEQAISCSTPPTSTTPLPAASWPKSCASAPAWIRSSSATRAPRPTRAPSK